MKYDFELIPVPTDALEAVGIIPGVMAEAFVDGKRIVCLLYTSPSPRD